MKKIFPDKTQPGSTKHAEALFEGSCRRHSTVDSRQIPGLNQKPSTKNPLKNCSYSQLIAPIRSYSRLIAVRVFFRPFPGQEELKIAQQGTEAPNPQLNTAQLEVHQSTPIYTNLDQKYYFPPQLHLLRCHSSLRLLPRQILFPLAVSFAPAQ